MGICSQTTVFYEPWNFSTPFLKIHLYFGVNHCGNEAHNLIIICVKKYFLLFTMNLLPDSFIQCSVAFVCDKECARCLCEVLGVLSHQSRYSADRSSPFILAVTESKGLSRDVKPYSALGLYVEIYR